MGRRISRADLGDALDKEFYASVQRLMLTSYTVGRWCVDGCPKSTEATLKEARKQAETDVFRAWDTLRKWYGDDDVANRHD